MTGNLADACSLGLLSAWSAHPGIAGAWCAVPGPEGARLFRMQGWVGLRAACRSLALGSGLAPDLMHIVDDLPPPGEPPASPGHRPRILGRSAGTNGVDLELQIPFGLAIFTGHFPTIPIVPGAMLVGWAAESARELLGWKVDWAAHQTAKFRRIVQPGQHLQLELSLRQESTQLQFRYSGPHGVQASGLLVGSTP